MAEWARQDAALTHPHPVCVQANALFALAVARAVREPAGARGTVPDDPRVGGERRGVPPGGDRAGRQNDPPDEYDGQQGWVLIAFQNALWQLLHAPSLEEGFVDTVMRGGDTDTNAAICGALLGAVYGAAAVPARWEEALRACRPEAGRPGVKRPRPAEYWPVDAEELAVSFWGKEAEHRTSNIEHRTLKSSAIRISIGTQELRISFNPQSNWKSAIIPRRHKEHAEGNS